MKRTTRHRARLLLLLFGEGLLACASTNEARRPEVSASSVASASKEGPCAPTDCAPCDETKQKCMGPMVCDHHPERAMRVCTRDADGQCKSKLTCSGG
jgi:hypothetical protein